MIISVKRWRPLALPMSALRKIKVRPTKESRKARVPGYLESFEKMAEHYADLLIKASTE